MPAPIAHTARRNYLAHLLLAGPHEDAMLGAFLGDFVKGRDLSHLAPLTAREVVVHRRIDSHTDSHPLLIAAKQRFAPERRRFAGIALDVFHDHVLASDFEIWAHQSLETFTRRAYAVFERHAMQMPEPARAVAQRMARHDWLGSYAHRENVARALDGISRRLSQGGELLRACLPDLENQRDELTIGFPKLFGDLQAFAQQVREHLAQTSTPEDQRQTVGAASMPSQNNPSGLAGGRL